MLAPCLLLVLATGGVEGFLPRAGLEPEEYTVDFTHQVLTETTVYLSLLQHSQSHITKSQLMSALKGDTRALRADTLRAYIDRTDAGALRNAVQQIVKATLLAARSSDPLWHFQSEKIAEGNALITETKDRLARTLKQDDLVTARYLMGYTLTLIQDFYANTNWVETHGPAIATQLGTRDNVTMGRIAAAGEKTCHDCLAAKQTCLNNLISNEVLTSDYINGLDMPLGKCSGKSGINKDSASSRHSPHYRLHTTAANASLQHGVHLLNNYQTGLQRIVGEERYLNLLGVDVQSSLVIVLDTTLSMEHKMEGVRKGIAQVLDRNLYGSFILVTFRDQSDEIETEKAAKIEPRIQVQKTTSSGEILKWLADVNPVGGGDCDEMVLTATLKGLALANQRSDVVIVTDASARDAHLAAEVSALAVQKEARISSLLTGDCLKDFHA